MSGLQEFIAWIVAIVMVGAIVLSIIFSFYGDAANGKSVDKACINSGYNTQVVDIKGDNTEQLVKVCIIDTPSASTY